MYKICFDNSDKIIGFNFKNSFYYINLFDINNIQKTIEEYEYIQTRDSLGRKLYYQYDKKLNSTDMVYVIQDNTNYEYTNVTSLKPISKNYLLIDNCNKFSIDDILSEKKKQLINNFSCKNCLLYEFVNDSEITFSNASIGKNVIIIDNEISSEKIQLSDNSKIAIYYESDIDLNIKISSNQIDWIDINKDEFINYNENEIYLKFISSEQTNIYCVAILIN